MPTLSQFYVNFRITLISSFVKKNFWDFDWNCKEPINQNLGKTDTLRIWALIMHKKFSLFVWVLISHSKIYRLCVPLLNIHKYLMHFSAIINGTSLKNMYLKCVAGIYKYIFFAFWLFLLSNNLAKLLLIWIITRWFKILYVDNCVIYKYSKFCFFFSKSILYISLLSYWNG